VYAAAAGTVVFAGELAGRTMVSIAHPGGVADQL
jgi:murein DD-endopeptidase MepM/ murein hydrolase activator NlpD